MDTISSIIVLFVGFLIGWFLQPYLGQKGRNLATKEDMGEITRKIEEVKSEYSERIQELVHQNSLLLEQTKTRNQLRMAALEKRLNKHQQAYSLWRKMISTVHSEASNRTVMECQDWYNNNCLFLESKAREAFLSAFGALAIHSDLIASKSDKETIKSNFKDITRAGEVIVSSIELPSLGDLEYETISEDKSSNKLSKWTPQSGAPS